MTLARSAGQVLLLIVTACAPLVPATTPPQLQHTPGAFVIVDEESYDAGTFCVDYPDGWRVVKLNTAGQPAHVVFAAPDDRATLQLSVQPLPAQDDTTARYERRDEIALGQTSVFLMGSTQPEHHERFDALYERVRATIRLCER